MSKEFADHHSPEEVKERNEKKIERIHIGGLDPSRLKGSEVAKRLESIEGLEIVSIDAINDSKPFFYVNASSEREGTTALDLIVKQYHNVRWKGCKIIVQAAKPPFLERLVKERAERAAREENLSALIYNYHNGGTKDPEIPKNIPRHMRIRQMYGTDAYHVDTKPCQVGDWRDFSKALLKMRSRRTKNTDEEKNMHKVFMNRAVHLRFAQQECPRSSIENQLLGTDTSSQSDLDGKEEEIPGKHSSYVWSDSEGEASVTGTEANAHEIDTSVFALAVKENEQVYVPVLDKLAYKSSPLLRVDDPINGSDTNEISSDDSEQGNHIDDGTPIHGDGDNSDDEEVKQMTPMYESKKHDTKQSVGGFQWSSDEDDDGDVGGHPLLRERKEAKFNEEFSAALDFGVIGDDESDADDMGGVTQPFLVANNSTVDLNDDVKANLGVLSMIFPGMEASPKKVTDPTYGASNSFGSLGMQRYDPTKESSMKFEVKLKGANEENLIKAKGDLSHDGSSSGDDDSRSQPKDKGKRIEGRSHERQETEADVYEEKKLEDIFRAAREGKSDGFLMGTRVSEVTITPRNNDELSGSAFSFGFDLGAPKEEPTKEVAYSSSLLFDSKPSTDVVAERQVEESPTEGPEVKRLRRRGFTVPQETLTAFVKSFFEMNEGLYIVENPEGFRHDEDIKSSWKEERYSLTLDWKRKKKYAQSQIQKKMKFR